MVESTRQILLFAGFLSEAFLFVISILYCYRDANPAYLRTFPVFCFVEAVADLVISLPGASEIIKSSTYNVLTLAELSYLCYLLTRFIHSRATKWVVWLLFALFCLQFSKQLLTYGIGHLHLIETFLESLILIIPCLVFLKEIFTSDLKTELGKDPAFWIVTGTLFNFTISIPLVLSQHYFIVTGSPHFAKDITIINSFSLIVSNVLYTKACVCRIIK